MNSLYFKNQQISQPGIFGPNRLPIKMRALPVANEIECSPKKSRIGDKMKRKCVSFCVLIGLTIAASFANAIAELDVLDGWFGELFNVETVQAQERFTPHHTAT